MQPDSPEPNTSQRVREWFFDDLCSNAHRITTAFTNRDTCKTRYANSTALKMQSKHVTDTKSASITLTDTNFHIFILHLTCCQFHNFCSFALSILYVDYSSWMLFSVLMDEQLVASLAISVHGLGLIGISNASHSNDKWRSSNMQRITV